MRQRAARVDLAIKQWSETARSLRIISLFNPGLPSDLTLIPGVHALVCPLFSLRPSESWMMTQRFFSTQMVPITWGGQVQANPCVIHRYQHRLQARMESGDGYGGVDFHRSSRKTACQHAADSMCQQASYFLIASHHQSTCNRHLCLSQRFMKIFESSYFCCNSKFRM